MNDKIFTPQKCNFLDKNRLNTKINFATFQQPYVGCLHETGNEILFRHEKNSVYINFHCRQNEIKVRFGDSQGEIVQ